MDKITDFFKEVKNRLTNPFISSFILSWLITNWRIPVGFFKYTNEELHKDAYGGYMQLVYNEAEWCNFFWIPFIVAVFYTLGWPFIHGEIISIHSRIRVYYDKKNIEIMKEHYVPMDTYVKKKEKFDEAAKQLQKIYKEDSDTIKLNEKLITEKRELEGKLTSSQNQYNDLLNNSNSLQSNFETLRSISAGLKKQVEIYSSQTNLKHLEGTWQLTQIEKQHDTNRQTDLTIVIKGDKMYHKLSTNNEPLLFNILAFYYDYDNKTVKLTLEKINISNAKWSQISVQTLTVSNHYNGHIGTMAGKSSLSYEVRYSLQEGPPIEELNGILPFDSLIPA